MSDTTSIAIIGAGPYGLSIAAHLSALNVDFRIYGGPMRTWIEAMPRGMLLKSDGFASNLHDPAGAFTLETYCAEQGLPYHPTRRPVPLETFSAYGEAFQKRFAPHLEDKTVTSLTQGVDGFELRFEDGSRLSAKSVVVASGIRAFAAVPAELAELPAALVGHASCYSDLSEFAGREVAVIGGGASAIDIASLLLDAGASVTTVTRKPNIRFHSPPSDQRSLADVVLRPMTGLGPSWKSWLCCNAPLLFHAMPERFRLSVVRRHLGPAPGWYMREKVEGRLPIITDARIASASVEDGRVRLALSRGDGSRPSLVVDRVVAATGYRVDLERLEFLGADLRGKIRLTGRSPALSRHFESSVPGLYFVGATAADSFGPLLRFAFGAGFTAQHLTQRLKRRAAKAPVSTPAGAPRIAAAE
jgi:cation diffusion facilitator CzcD-associated flavoprotein CzcO